jgi:hypothetical protein
MTPNKAPKYTNILTPTGTAIWPKLNAPDTKYKANGEFNVKLKLSAEDAQPIIDQYEKELAAYFEEVQDELMKGDGKSKAKARGLKLAADKPYKDDFDDQGEPTGDVVINFKMPHRIIREGKSDLLLFPDIFDAGGKKLKNPPEIWGGSKLRVSGQLRPFNAPIGVGISMRLQAVQIIELSTKGARDAAGYGFGAEEGYTAEDEAAPESPFAGGAEAGDSSDNPDF